jgi:SAM-dependent methyltransferase
MKFIEKVMDIPIVYQAFQNFVYTTKSQETIDNLLSLGNNSSVLDFGCGTGIYSEKFLDSFYIGIDPLDSCIARAKSKYGETQSRKFLVGDETILSIFIDRKFDLILAMGVLHHMEDRKASVFLSEAIRLLKSNGVLVCLEPLYFEGQSKISRFMVSRDRGKYARNEPGYKRLFPSGTQGVVLERKLGLLRIPYDQVAIMYTPNKEVK